MQNDVGLDEWPVRSDARARPVSGIAVEEFVARTQLPCEMLLKLLPTVFESARQDIGAMRAAYDEGQWEETRRIAHRLKGTAGSFSLPRMAALAAEAEACAFTIETAALPGIFFEIEAELVECTTAAARAAAQT